MPWSGARAAARSGVPLPQDVYDVAYDILNARLALSYRALAEGFTIDDVLVELLTTVPAPGSHTWPPVNAVSVAPAAAAHPTPDPVSGRQRVLIAPAETPPIVLPGDPTAAR